MAGFIDAEFPKWIFQNGHRYIWHCSKGMRPVHERWNRQVYCSDFRELGYPSVYSVDSIKVNKAGTADSIEYASVHAVPDTGIIVDDTVRHFAAIGEQWGDLNNDGIEDLILNGLNATDNRDGNDSLKGDIILYGNGDGTFTYKWDGVHVVAQRIGSGYAPTRNRHRRLQ